MKDSRIPESVLDDAFKLMCNNQDVQLFHNVMRLFVDTYTTGLQARVVRAENSDDRAVFEMVLSAGDDVQFQTMRTAAEVILAGRFYCGQLVFDAKNAVTVRFECWNDKASIREAHKSAPPALVLYKHAVSRKRRRRPQNVEREFVNAGAGAVLDQMIELVGQSKKCFQNMTYEFGEMPVDKRTRRVFWIRQLGDVTIEFLLHFYRTFQQYVDDMLFIDKDMCVCLNEDVINFNTIYSIIAYRVQQRARALRAPCGDFRSVTRCRCRHRCIRIDGAVVVAV